MTNCIVGEINDIPHAVIDTRFVDGKDMLHKFPGHLVSVLDEAGATYHVGLAGANCLPNAVLMARGILFKDGFVPALAPRYRNATIIDFLNNKEYIFDPKGDYRVVALGAQ